MSRQQQHWRSHKHRIGKCFRGSCRAAALELAEHGIRVNAIAPGPINTPMLAERLNEPGGREWLEDKVPMGRLGEPEDCARGIAFLLSDESSYITGVTLPIDGGWLTR